MTTEQVRPEKKVSLPIGEEIQQLFGRKDEVRKLIEETLQVKLALRLFMKKEEEEFKRIQGELIEVSSKKRPVRAKGPGQRRYIEAIRRHDIVFAIGPAGTGKTYLAMAMAVSALLKHEVNRIILTRPAVEAGEKLGFLPGTLYEKINPYLRPLYDALYDMIELERANRMMEMGTIEIAPLAFMRGRILTCLLRNLYADKEATVRTGHGTTDWFQIGKGVCQGCILSPCLVNFYEEYIKIG